MDVFDDEEELETFAIALSFVLAHDTREDYVVRQRLNWKKHVKMLRRERQFKEMYRMRHTSFNKLLDLLRPSLIVNDKQARCASKGHSPIIPELILHCTLRYLAGGSVHDIRVTAGLSRASFYRVVTRCIDAINDCRALDFSFPRTEVELRNAAAKFEQLSSDEVMKGCVGALDGWLCRIRVPPKGTPNVISYFSGHYQCYGLNVQACCDADCRFTCISIMCPGSAGDSRALFSSVLNELIENLPDGFYVLADNAYTLSSRLIVPYCGRDKADKSKDVFNFYLSQLRIRIEQAFGLLVTKWRVFKRPLEVSLNRAPQLVLAAARLHNFCIDEREVEAAPVTSIDPQDYRPHYEMYMDLRPRSNRRSGVREAITNQLRSDGRSRPQYNIQRNNRV